MTENNFAQVMESLFKGMDAFLSAKTVIGEATKIGDIIILPLVDVSFGVGAGLPQGKRKWRWRRYDRKNVTECRTCHQTGWLDQTGQCQESGHDDKDS